MSWKLLACSQSRQVSFSHHCTSCSKLPDSSILHCNHRVIHPAVGQWYLCSLALWSQWPKMYLCPFEGMPVFLSLCYSRGWRGWWLPKADGTGTRLQCESAACLHRRAQEALVLLMGMLKIGSTEEGRLLTRTEISHETKVCTINQFSQKNPQTLPELACFAGFTSKHLVWPATKIASKSEQRLKLPPKADLELRFFLLKYGQFPSKGNNRRVFVQI